MCGFFVILILKEIMFHSQNVHAFSRTRLNFVKNERN